MRQVATDAPPRLARITGTWAAVFAALVGFGATAAFALTARSSFIRTENRLLRLQTKLTEAAIQAADPLYVNDNLGGAAKVASASPRPVQQFANFLSDSVGKNGPFTSASLWRIDHETPHLVTEIGSPVLSPRSAIVQRLLRRAPNSTSFVVEQIERSHAVRLVYASARSGPMGTYVAYAEEPLPSDRRITVPASSPLSNFYLALYLGHSKSHSVLLETDYNRPLPMQGRSYTTTIPFGDSVLTLTLSPRQPISGEFDEDFPWIISAVGGVLSLLAAAMILRLVRGRRRAEVLADANRSLYRRHREISETLQRSILPKELPRADGIEFAARYLPGAVGMEVGGDWYSVIEAAPKRYIFVIGDVSGRGLQAATIMASLRYTTRTLALLGIRPSEILAHAGREVDFQTDGHFATVLVGEIDLENGAVEIASAGHLPALLVHDGVGEFIGPPARAPLGVVPTDYPSIRVPFGPGATLFTFTDGLVERRGELLDRGLERLRETAVDTPGSVEELVDSIVSSFSGNDTDDDLAVLAIRRTDSAT